MMRKDRMIRDLKTEHPKLTQTDIAFLTKTTQQYVSIVLRKEVTTVTLRKEYGITEEDETLLNKLKGGGTHEK